MATTYSEFRAPKARKLNSGKQQQQQQQQLPPLQPQPRSRLQQADTLGRIAAAPGQGHGERSPKEAAQRQQAKEVWADPTT